MRVTIFGGTGFLGSAIVAQLVKAGYKIRIVARNLEKAQALNFLGSVGQIAVVPFSVNSKKTVAKAIENTDAVINAVGILNQTRGNRFEKLHVEFPTMVAQACAKNKIRKLVHVSSMAVSEGAKSRYSKSKFLGEQAVHQLVSTASIVAPNAIFGPEDKFFNLFALTARICPFIPLVGKGKNKLNPVYVGDVARFISHLLEQEDTEYARYQIQGSRNHTMKELVQMTLNQMGKKRLIVPIPYSIASFTAKILGIIPLINFPLTRDSVEMATQDLYLENPEENALIKSGIRITPVEEILPTYII